MRGLGLQLGFRGVVRGSGPLAPILLVNHGNSLTAGYLTNQTVSAYMIENLPAGLTVSNRGLSGYNTSQLTTDLNAGNLDAYLNVSGSRKVLAIWEVVNDMRATASGGNNQTPAQAVANLTTYISAAKARYPGVEVWIVTPVSGAFDASWTTTTKATVLGLIRANYATYGATGIIDLDADSRFQTSTNRRYFQSDTLHLTNSANAAAARIYSDTLVPGKWTASSSWPNYTSTDLSGAPFAQVAGNRSVVQVGDRNTLWATVRGTTSRSTGKYYFEAKADVGYVVGGGSASDAFHLIGLCNAALTSQQYLGQAAVSAGFSNAAAGRFLSGFTAGAAYTGNGAGYSLNDAHAIAVDFDAGKVWRAINNVWTTGDPVAGTNAPATFTANTALFPALALRTEDFGWSLRLASADLKYTPPTGFSSWL